MIKLLSSRLLWGVILIVGGILLLLDTFNIFEGNALFWTIVIAAAGILFISVYISTRDNWWALVPGIIFLAISVAIGLDAFLPGFHEADLSGPIILAGIALSFLFVFLVERLNWWAIIPAGVMGTIAIVAVLDSVTSGLASGGIFFLGLGITFAMVALLPAQQGQMRWAWIPALILGIMGFLILIAAENLINYIWPFAIILVGLWLVWRALRVNK
jgi:hypothetical protein